jgi:tRNA-2-methylthio-N6-dimethylallyladenosine synthase
MRRVLIETYGCQMNVADSDLALGVLAEQGYGRADSLEDADIILVNTCAVRENAEERVIRRLENLRVFKVKNPDVILGVMGCMAEHLKESLLDRAPYVDLVVGPDGYRRLPELVAAAGLGDPMVDVRLDRSEVYEGIPRVRGPGVGGFVTVQRGCDKFCSFCVVPFTRGRERGVAPREVLRQVREMATEGYREVTLLGQTVNSYRYEDVSFADLLRAVATVEGIARIRFTSPYPVDFDAELIRTIAEVPEIMPYLHLPVQSASDRLLKRMKRGHTIAEYRTLVSDLREAVPGLALSTDIIVGFPGETEADFVETLELVEELRYDFAFMFAYSERDMTYAAKSIPDDIPQELKVARLERLIALQEGISATRFAPKVGTEVEVLVEGPSRRDPADLVGRTPDFKTTIIRGGRGVVRPGQIIRVLVASATSHTLLGEALVGLDADDIALDAEGLDVALGAEGDREADDLVRPVGELAG